MPDTDPLTSAVLGYSASQRCNVANPGGQPCSRRKGHAGSHDLQSYGPTEPTVEDCLRELREMFPNWPSEIEITTDGIFYVKFWPSKLATVKEMRSGHSLSKCMAQVRSWNQEQEKSNA